MISRGVERTRVRASCGIGRGRDAAEALAVNSMSSAAGRRSARLLGALRHRPHFRLLTAQTKNHTLKRMQYLIARDGQQLGQFSEEEIRSGLFEGRYHPTDSAWTEGVEDWCTLADIMGQAVTRVSKPRPVADTSIRPSPTKVTGIAIAALVLLGVGIIS